jgi:hypothetical protein
VQEQWLTMVLAVWLTVCQHTCCSNKSHWEGPSRQGGTRNTLHN